MNEERNAVPCGNCHACCRNERIFLSPEHGDDPAQYYTTPTRKGLDGPIEWMLLHKSNGNCIYLDEQTGCTIHDHAPWACRQFDCRRWLLGFPDAMQDLLSPDDLDGAVISSARRLLDLPGAYWLT